MNVSEVLHAVQRLPQTALTRRQTVRLQSLSRRVDEETASVALLLGEMNRRFTVVGLDVEEQEFSHTDVWAKSAEEAIAASGFNDVDEHAVEGVVAHAAIDWAKGEMTCL